MAVKGDRPRCGRSPDDSAPSDSQVAGLMSTGRGKRSRVRPPSFAGRDRIDHAVPGPEWRPGDGLVRPPPQGIIALMRSLRALIRFLLLVLLVGGCSGLAVPPQREATVSRPHADAPGRRYVRVARGDTVTAIARRHGVTVRALVDANGLESPDRLRVGQLLRLPAPGGYTVRPGDSLLGIARRFDIDPERLARLNRLDRPWTLRPGQVLAMPVTPEDGGTVPVPVLRSAPTAAQPEAGTDWLGGILARILSVDPPAPDPPPDDPAAAASRTAARTLEPVPAALPALEGGRLMWPVRGPVISAFGPGGDGLRNDGINIAAPTGTPVLAAGHGEVILVARELAGFGTLVLIRHASGLVTAYAHVGRVLVREGDTIRRGTTIATVGTSGGVRRPQLHFEVRRGATALDPELHLGS